MANLYDRPSVRSVLGDVDGAIHVASPGDATSADLDSAVVDAAIGAYAGTAKPYLHISGMWICGNNPSISEDSALNPRAGGLEGADRAPAARCRRHAQA